GAGTGARVAGGTAPGGVGVAGRTVVPVAGGATGSATGTGTTVPGPGGTVAGSPAPAHEGWSVAVLVVANAAGTPVGARTTTGGTTTADETDGTDETTAAQALPGLLNTTLAVVVTDAALDPAAATRLAAAAHAGLARAVDPSHTLVDGDVVLALATGRVAAPTDVRDRVGLEAAAASLVTEAFARAVAGGTMAG
ncbi:P1 family peptidase, partial [Aquipuribacter hungaricus]